MIPLHRPKFSIHPNHPSQSKTKQDPTTSILQIESNTTLPSPSLPLPPLPNTNTKRNSTNKQTTKQPNNQTNNTIKQTTQTIKQSNNKSNKQTNKQSTNQSTNQSADERTNEQQRGRTSPPLIVANRLFLCLLIVQHMKRYSSFVEVRMKLLRCFRLMQVGVEWRSKYAVKTGKSVEFSSDNNGRR